jgi:hypothetical protein
MPARTPRIPHLIGNKIVDLPNVYATISEITGISALQGTPPEGSETASLRTLITDGAIRRATATLSNGKTRDIFMVAAKAPLVGALAGATYGADRTDLTIKRAHFKQQIRLG